MNKPHEIDIEQWLLKRLGAGNTFERFNREFCKALTHAAQKKMLEYMFDGVVIDGEWVKFRDFNIINSLLKDFGLFGIGE